MNQLIERKGMKFDGRIGDLGSKNESITYFDKTYSCRDKRGLESGMKKDLKKLRLEVVNAPIWSKDGDIFKCVVRVKSLMGIV